VPLKFVAVKAVELVIAEFVVASTFWVAGKITGVAAAVTVTLKVNAS
jgi:hypothetical protein